MDSTNHKKTLRETMRKLLVRGKVCFVRSDLKSQRVYNAHFVHL